LLLHLRAQIAEGIAIGTEAPTKRKALESFAFRMYAFAWSRPWLYELGGRVLRVLQRPAVRDGRIGQVGKLMSKLLPPLGAWTAWRDARPLAPQSFREMWRANNQQRG